MNVKVINKSNNPLPEYKTTGSAGMDLMASKYITIEPGQIKTVPTGLFVEIPIGYEGQVRSRSGLSIQGLVVNNAPGTIDSDFRGEVKIILRNQSDKMVGIAIGDRIAQLVFAKVEQINWITEEQLSETDRS